MTDAQIQDRASAKGAGDENFPVGSILIERRLRSHVARLYAFARAADDVADHPALEQAEKLRRLEAFGRGLDGGRGPAEAAALRASLGQTGVTAAHAHALLAAFAQDARIGRYADWAALMDYCALSAAPVGRYLLDLHGEDRRAWRASDALCAALQVLNHLQDLADDRRRLDRVYLPRDWMAAEGATVAMLDAPRTTPALRRVIDRALDGCDALLRTAEPLPRLIVSRRLAAEAAVIGHLAVRLTRRLRREDPLAARVRLSPLDAAAAAARGAMTLARGARGARGGGALPASGRP